MAEKLTQCSKILEHIRCYGSITPREAEDLYGVMRLASRINDLRRFGHEITSEIVDRKNRDGSRVRYAVYRMAKESTF